MNSSSASGWNRTNQHGPFASATSMIFSGFSEPTIRNTPSTDMPERDLVADDLGWTASEPSSEYLLFALHPARITPYTASEPMRRRR